jgi:hypothetical protein
MRGCPRRCLFFSEPLLGSFPLKLYACDLGLGALAFFLRNTPSFLFKVTTRLSFSTCLLFFGAEAFCVRSLPLTRRLCFDSPTLFLFAPCFLFGTPSFLFRSQALLFQSTVSLFFFEAERLCGALALKLKLLPLTCFGLFLLGKLARGFRFGLLSGLFLYALPLGLGFLS